MVEIRNSIDLISSFSESISSIGVFYGRSTPEQLHCGIAFKSKGKFNAIHLAWHTYLQCENNYENNLSNYFWVKPSINEIRQKSISAMCRRIWKRNSEQKIPYGLHYENSSFHQDGLLKLGPSESGLTCATFVMAIFKSCGIKLIDTTTWKQREEDSQWHKSIINSLDETKERFSISKKHIENVSNEIGCARFRPEEVAISTYFEKIPASFEIITQYGEAVKNLLPRI